MNKEKDLNLQAENVSETEKKRANFLKQTAQPRFIALAILALALVIFAVIYLLANRNSQANRVIPAPRNVSFGQDDANDDASNLPAEQTLTLAPEQIEQIKLETEMVGETLSAEVAGATSTGVVQANAYAETPVISLVGGVVRNVSAELGEFVRQGETIAVVFSNELATAESNYLTMIAEVDEADKRYDRALKLTEIAAESRTELDQATAAVQIAKAELAEHLSDYKRTEKLIEIGAASRQDFEMARTKHETAQAKLDEANKRLERAKKLLNINPQRRAELDAALTQKRTTEAKTDAERQKLLVFGLSPQQVNQIKQTRRVSSDLPIQSPVSGTVTARIVNSGEIIQANKELFKVTNLGTVWVIAEVYEKDLPQIRTGSGATVTSDAYSDRVFRGKVTYIDPNFNQTTRTAQVRVELENPEQIFKVGMYVNVAFGSIGTAERTAPIVPSSAVQTVNNQKIVFLATDKPNVFLLKQVRLGTEINGRYIVLEGVNVGDKIVTDGSFLLRAEWIKQHPAGQ